MIPLSLTIKGLYSYQEECTIDFTQLTGSGLFGIFGAVGSGKSAILEAITYALYGNTERLGPKEKRSYNMMNLKSNELLIEFVFDQEDDGIYKFCVQGKRSKKNFDKIEKFDRTAYAYQKADDTWLPIEAGSAEEIIGLNYNNFHKTVIIPQGRFHEFLYMSDSDRTRMLQDIFNLDKYDLYKKTSVLVSRNRNRLNTETVMLEKLNHVTRAAINSKQDELKAYSKDKITFQEKLKELEETTKEAERVRELYSKIDEARQTKEGLEADEKLYEERKARLAAYKTAYTHFYDLLKQQGQIKQSISRKEETLTAKAEQQIMQDKKIEEVKKAFEKTKAAYDRRDRENQQLKDLENISLLAELETESVQLAGQLKESKKKAADSAKILEEKKESKKRALLELEQCTRDMPDIVVLMELERWFSRQDNLLKKTAEVNTKITVREEKLKVLENDIKTAASQVFTGPVNREDLLERLSEKNSDFAKQQEQLARTVREFELQEKLGTIALGLSDGQPCPLCGSKEHPAPLDPGSMGKELEEARRTMATLEEEIKKVNSCKTLVSELKSTYIIEETNLKELKSEYSDLRNQLTGLNGEFTWQEYSKDDKKIFEQNFRETGKKQEQIKLITAECEGIDLEIEKCSALAGKETDSLSKLTTRQTALEAKKQTLTGQLVELHFDQFRSLAPAEIKKRSGVLKTKLEGLEKSFSKTQQELAGLIEVRNRTDGEINNLKNNLEEIRTELADSNKELDKRRKEHGFPSLDHISSLLERPIDIEGAAKDLELYYRNLHTWRETYRLLQSEAEGRTFDEKSYRDLVAEKEEITNRLDSLAHSMGEAAARLDELQKDIAEKTELEQSLQTLKKRDANLRHLLTLFKGSGFVNYVSKIFLQELCFEANKRFHVLTRRQLHLELTQNNSFQVRDYLNDGQWRSIKTLSGGQVFQASLSLALALSSHIKNRRQISQSFFFIDEGFGTQDSESLQLVFESLQSLRKEGRTVGIISHVDELKQEIDTFLAVSRDEKKGSLLSYSYEN